MLATSAAVLVSNTASSSNLFGVDWQAQASDNVFGLNGQVAALALFANTAVAQSLHENLRLGVADLTPAMSEVQGMRYVQVGADPVHLQASDSGYGVWAFPGP